MLLLLTQSSVHNQQMLCRLADLIFFFKHPSALLTQSVPSTTVAIGTALRHMNVSILTLGSSQACHVWRLYLLADSAVGEQVVVVELRL